ncbi:MAG TPA: glycosyltransferase family 4 protein [Thermoanaerobaculia bacterium]|nr:glycosyltransferase family 4 protein [Thermoanaerobaculia bacterium]
MNVLIVATKSPWPPVDGGRLLLSLTLEGLEREGCRFTLIAPELGPASPALAVARSWRLPLALARHAQPAVRQEVERRLAAERFDLVHVEQLQALPQAEPALRRGVPVVLRAQNVESDLWQATAALTSGWKGRVLAREARRLAKWEGEAVRRVAATLPLSEEDAARLRQLAGVAGGGRVRVVRAPFPALAPGPSVLPGDPPVVLLASRGWLPNEDSVRWFLGEVWPAVRAEVPGATLHVFGGEPGEGVVPHPSPRDSAEAFAPGSILAVPLRIGSGVRMKVLEAWARGVPVVGTSAAVSGLEVEDGREALVADDPAAFARAVARFRCEAGLAQLLVENGRRALRERHEPARVVADLLSVYEEVRGSWPAARSEGS